MLRGEPREGRCIRAGLQPTRDLGTRLPNGKNKKTDPFSQVGFPYFFRTACGGKRGKSDNYLIYMVGGAGFEPATLAV